VHVKQLAELDLPAAADVYLGAGLSVLPTVASTKRPAMKSWKRLQSRAAQPGEFARQLTEDPDRGIAIVGGRVSGNVEILDFDRGGELLDAWIDLVEALRPGLAERLVYERTPSGGFHALYKCEEPVDRSTKLAMHVEEDPTGDRPRKSVSIETRGEGGYCICWPTRGYQLLAGHPTKTPVLTSDERHVLLSAARSLNEEVEFAEPEQSGSGSNSNVNLDRPGDDFNRRGCVRQILESHGWRRLTDGENEHWCRPGKDDGTSATLRDRVLFVFSTNAQPFESDTPYSPFAVFTFLEHGGDFGAAASALRAMGYGDHKSCPSAPRSLDGKGPTTRTVHDAGQRDQPAERHPPLTADELRVPGFIGMVMDHCLNTAPYSNPVLAFGGALALQACLAGRLVRDPGDVRPNVYIVALAPSGCGKDWPRKVNARILSEAGLIDRLGDQLGSGEGLQDALLQTPSILLQIDEVDSLLQAIGRSRDGRHESIVATLLSAYSSSNSVVPKRKLAGQECGQSVDQPNLVIFGSAIPEHFFAALSERMLTNGLFARLLPMEANRRGRRARRAKVDPPEAVVEIARWWAKQAVGAATKATPQTVPMTDEAQELADKFSDDNDDRYDAAVKAGNTAEAAVWARTGEHASKLALLYAVSADHENSVIDVPAVEWANRIVLHLTGRMLEAMELHTHSSPFDAAATKCIRHLRTAPNCEMSRSKLLRKTRFEKSQLDQILETLSERGDIIEHTQATSGRSAKLYRYVGSKADESAQEATEI
jgi:hypothetical protein